MNLQGVQRDPVKFRQALLIDTDQGPRPLAEVADDWQLEDFQALDPLWQRGGRAWLERGRGHSKTSDVATMVSWRLFSSRRAVRGVVAAGDKDQAALLRDAVATLCRLNPWLGQILDVQSGRILNRHTDSECQILTSDAPTSYGILPDFVVCDELTHWAKRDLWDSLLSSAAKRSGCLLLVICNAGFMDSWQYQTREAIRTDEAWYFSRLDGPRASWISQAILDEQERLLPPIAYRRLWLNEWTHGAGDALDWRDIEAAVTLAGPHRRPLPGFIYVGGLDIGVRRDHAAFVMLGCEFATGQVHLANCQHWEPSAAGDVDLAAVEGAILSAQSTFSMAKVCFDPHQAEYLSQRLGKFGLNMHRVPFTGQHLHTMTTALIEAFSSGTISLYRHSRLARDLRQLRIEEKSYGFRLTASRTDGHGDRAIALSICLPHANRRALAMYRYDESEVTRVPAPQVENGRYGVHLKRHESKRDQQARTVSSMTNSVFLYDK